MQTMRAGRPRPGKLRYPSRAVYRESFHDLSQTRVVEIQAVVNLPGHFNEAQ